MAHALPDQEIKDWADETEDELVITEGTDDAADGEKIDDAHPPPETDEPKAKKRGRPPKDQTDLQKRVKVLETENASLQKQITTERKKYDNELKRSETDSKTRVRQLQKEIEELKDVQANTLSDLDMCQRKLEDSETERMEMIEQLAADNSLNSSTKPKAKGTVLCDEAMKPVLKHLQEDKIEWYFDEVDLKQLKGAKEAIDKLSKTDIILFLTGSTDIRQGMKGHDAFNILHKVAQELSTTVVICPIAPSHIKGTSVQVSLLNYKIDKMELKDTQVINIPLTGLTKKDIIDENDNLTPKAIECYANSINSQIREPTIKPPTGACANITETESPQKMQAVYEVQHSQIGKVIGKSGGMINRISRDFNVTLNIGKWSEPKKDNRDEFDDVMQAVLITGLSNDVKKAIKFIENLLSSEPTPKRSKPF